MKLVHKRGTMSVHALRVADLHLGHKGVHTKSSTDARETRMRQRSDPVLVARRSHGFWPAIFKYSHPYVRGYSSNDVTTTIWLAGSGSSGIADRLAREGMVKAAEREGIFYILVHKWP